MQVSAKVEKGTQDDSRRAVRYRANTMATVRQQKQPNEMIHVVDISTVGCGFRSRWPFAAGARVWLGLPGIETWPASVVWYEDGKGGLRFERPLHSLVAERFAAEIEHGGD
jgi:PilZ domain